MAAQRGAKQGRQRTKSRWILAAALSIAACSQERADSECNGEAGSACTWAGTTTPGYNGEGLDRRASRLYWPVDLEFAPDGKPYVLDWNNHRVRRVEDDQTFTTVIGKFVGDGPSDQRDLTAHGALGETVSLNHPTDIQFDADGTMYLAAWHNHKIRTWSATDEAVRVMCGRGAGFAGDGTEGLETVRFSQPKSIVLGPDRALYVLDQRNQRVRKLGLGEVTEVSTVVGSGSAGFAADEATATKAQLNFETGATQSPRVRWRWTAKAISTSRTA